MKPNKIIGKKLNIINLGINIFFDALKKQNVNVCRVDWKPPVKKDEKIELLLKKLSK